LDRNSNTTYKKELIMKLDNFKWTRQKNGVLDFI